MSLTISVFEGDIVNVDIMQVYVAGWSWMNWLVLQGWDGSVKGDFKDTPQHREG